MRPRLASFELAWTNATFDAIYPEPPLGLLPHGVARMGPSRFFDSVLAQIPFEQWLGLRVTLWMIALAPLFTIRRFGTIASITPEDRGRVLERLVTSSNYFVRQLSMSFKAIATLLYAQSETVRAAMSAPLEAASRAHAHEQPIEPASYGLVSATRLTSRAKPATKNGGAHDHAA